MTKHTKKSTKRGKATPEVASINHLPPQGASHISSGIFPPSTTSQISADNTLGFKIRILIYDLQNISKDAASARRLNSTIDEHYFSTPYFTSDESILIKRATVDVEIPTHLNNTSPQGINGAQKSLSEALEILLHGFLDKRRASGDSRPCGPHDLAPVYAALFGISFDELRTDEFLSRLRRQGI